MIMSLMGDFFKLNHMADEVSSKLFQIYVSYLNGSIDFPYVEVEKLLNSYTLLYLETYKKKNSKINKLLRTIDSLYYEYEAPSKEMIIKQVNRKVFAQIYFEAHKYFPVDEYSKVVISGKLFPIVKDMTVAQLVDIYKKMKKSAMIRGVVLSDNSFALFQQVFVHYIMSVLSQKQNAKGRLTYDEVCMSMLNEPVLSFNNVNKRVKEQK